MLVAALLIVAVLVAAASSCSYTSAEAAYLDEIRQQSVHIDIAESDQLRQGYAICVTLAEIKPGENREQRARHLLAQEGYTYRQITAATAHLCPDIRLDPAFNL